MHKQDNVLATLASYRNSESPQVRELANWAHARLVNSAANHTNEAIFWLSFCTIIVIALAIYWVFRVGYMHRLWFWGKRVLLGVRQRRQGERWEMIGGHDKELGHGCARQGMPRVVEGPPRYTETKGRGEMVCENGERWDQGYEAERTVDGWEVREPEPCVTRKPIERP